MESIIGIVVSTIIALIAYKKESLNKSGVIAAIILGTAIFAFGGFIPFGLMMVFFISSSVLSKVGKMKKGKLESIHEKGDARDYIQVIANGGVALFFLVIFQVTKDIKFFIASAVSFAAANSDTWASEIGVLSKGKTISILTRKKIENGVSGGISLLGTISAFIGSALIAIFYIIPHSFILGYNNSVKVFTVITVLGFLGSLVDSFLGVTVQGQYIDKVDGHITEKKYSGNSINELVKGYSFINNDIVNMLSNFIATFVSILIL